VHIVIDIIHVLEYLWGAAHCLHPGDRSAECMGRRHAVPSWPEDRQAAASITPAAADAGFRPAHARASMTVGT